MIRKLEARTDVDLSDEIATVREMKERVTGIAADAAPIENATDGTSGASEDGSSSGGNAGDDSAGNSTINNGGSSGDTIAETSTSAEGDVAARPGTIDM